MHNLFFEKRLPPLLIMLMVLVSLLISCTADSGRESQTSNQELSDTEPVDDPDHDEHDEESEDLSLPHLEALVLNGEPLKVVATTNIIGDVVGHVGGDAIDLTVLIEPGQDPHSYEPGARELSAASNADVIFVNGWDLEESLATNIEEIGGQVPIAAISANIHPLSLSDEDAGQDHDSHGHGSIDPHVWFSIHNVEQWVKNTSQVLGELDPQNAGIFEKNAGDYLSELEELEAYASDKLGSIPQEKRFLVTNHNALNYFAQEYDFTILGTVIPGSSTLAEPSAGDLSILIQMMDEFNICTLFTETSVSDALVQTVAAELRDCPEVQVIPLYIGTIGPEGSGADSYIGMFRTNIDWIAGGLNDS